MTAGIATDEFAVAEPVSREELNRLVAVQRAAFLAEGVPGADVRKSRPGIASRTPTGDFLGHAATGKRFTVRNVQVMGFRDGKACDRWGSTDELGILQQLGLA